MSVEVFIFHSARAKKAGERAIESVFLGPQTEHPSAGEGAMGQPLTTTPQTLFNLGNCVGSTTQILRDLHTTEEGVPQAHLILVKSN